MKNRNEKGAVFIEASIVFPVMFLVIFFMIFAGNIYLQKAYAESVINKYTMEGAARCADPMLTKAATGKFPSAKNWEVYPYRAFDGDGVGNPEGEMKGSIQNAISKMGPGLFAGMNPVDTSVSTNYHNGVVYGTFTADVSFNIEMPIRLLGQEEHTKILITTHASAPVSDTPELIRNVEMAKDYAERSKTATKMLDTISGAMNKAKEWFSK